MLRGDMILGSMMSGIYVGHALAFVVPSGNTKRESELDMIVDCLLRAILAPLLGAFLGLVTAFIMVRDPIVEHIVPCICVWMALIMGGWFPVEA